MTSIRNAALAKITRSQLLTNLGSPIPGVPLYVADQNYLSDALGIAGLSLLWYKGQIISQTDLDSVEYAPDPFLDSRPNDGTGYWADNSNTGHTREPSYPGSLADYTTGMTDIGFVRANETDGTTVSYKRFVGKTGIGYDFGDNLTFVGCEFSGTQPNDNLIQIYCATKVTFKHCTFRPYSYTAPPGNDGTVSSAKTSPGTPYLQSWQLLSRMVAGQTIFENCNIWGGAGAPLTGGVDITHQSLFKNCYFHDCADNDGSGGSLYHHDLLGPDSEGGSHDTLIQHCTFASVGNTQGVALQGSSTYNRITVEDSYLSGLGYTLSLGNTEPWAGTNIIVRRNIFSAEMPNLFGPLYGNLWANGNGNLWEGNKFQVRAGDSKPMPVSEHGKFWWPTDNVGHDSDYNNS